MADDKSKKTITAKDVTRFLTDNPDAMSKLLAAQPELLAACITAAGTSIKTNDKIDLFNINFKEKIVQKKIKFEHLFRIILNLSFFKSRFSCLYSRISSLIYFNIEQISINNL